MTSGKPFQRREERMRAKIVFEDLFITSGNALISRGLEVRWEIHLHFKLKSLVLT